MPHAVRLALIAFGVVLVVAALLAMAFALVRRLLARADVYVFPRTMFGPALVYNVEGGDGEPVRVLKVGGTVQSATYLEDDRYTEPVFAYDRAFDLMFQARRPNGAGAPGEAFEPHRVLMIGGGGYAYPKHFIANHPAGSIDVVEVDPAIESIAQRYFFLDRLAAEYDTDETGRLGLICDDGRSYLDECVERYDAVVNDSFGGGTPAASLVTLEAARAARACLIPGGLYMANVVAALEGAGARFLRAEVATLSQVFAHVVVVPCAGGDFGGDGRADGAVVLADAVPAGTPGSTDRDNLIVIASDVAYAFPGMRTVLFDASDPVLTDVTVRSELRRLL